MVVEWHWNLQMDLLIPRTKCIAGIVRNLCYVSRRLKKGKTLKGLNSAGRPRAGRGRLTAQHGAAGTARSAAHGCKGQHGSHDQHCGHVWHDSSHDQHCSHVWHGSHSCHVQELQVLPLAVSKLSGPGSGVPVQQCSQDVGISMGSILLFHCMVTSKHR